MNNVKITVFYAKGIRLSLSQRGFREAMELVWQSPAFAHHTPQALKMVFTTTGKMLFMDENAFNSYLSKEISMEELVQLTECDELYRNKVEILTDEMFTVETGHLWKAKKEVLTLVDSDSPGTTKLDLTKFEIAL